MARMLRIALTLLLAFALPVQGYAANRMIACGSSHHHPMGFPVVQDIAAQIDPSCEHQQIFVPEFGNEGGSADAFHSKASEAKCSQCASCGAMPAIAQVPVVFQLAPAPPLFRTRPNPPSLSATTDAIERPPRIDLA